MKYYFDFTINHIEIYNNNVVKINQIFLKEKLFLANEIKL